MTYDPLTRIVQHFCRHPGQGALSVNERRVLRIVHQHPNIARADITALIALTQQSVHRILEALVARGLIAFSTPVAQKRGQPSPSVILCGDFAYTVGISIDTDAVGISLLSFAGEVLAERGFELHRQDMATVLARVETTVEAMRGACGLTSERLFGAGLAIAGYMISGTSYNAPLPLHEWSLIELGPLVSKRFGGLPVWVNNEANMAAVCEASLGVGRHIKNFVYLAFHYGLGGGIISDGELIAGGYGNAGELSGMFDKQTFPRRPALQSLLECLRDHGTDVPSIEYIHRRFDPDWPGISDWLDDVTPAYNQLINALCATVDPQAVVFGGQIPSSLASMLIARTEFYHNALRYGVSRREPKLLISNLKGHPSATGAAMTPLKNVFF
ncbi:MAG: ROK family transcriptional regulator [Pseudomonadota bacterium]